MEKLRKLFRSQWEGGGQFFYVLGDVQKFVMDVEEREKQQASITSFFPSLRKK